MTSFRLSVTPNRRAAAAFVGAVRRKLQKSYAENDEVTQTDIANALGIHRSVINRQLRGRQDMTLGRVAEIAWALGYEPVFDLVKQDDGEMGNVPSPVGAANQFIRIGQSSTGFSIEQSDARDPVLLDA